MRPLLVLVSNLAICANCLAEKVNVETLVTQSEPAIQDQITRIYTTLNQPGVDPRSNIAAFQEIQTLKEMVADKGEIVKQMAVFAAAPAEDEEQPLVATMILDLLDLPPSIVIRQLAPYLDAGDPSLRSFVRDWFQRHDNAGSDESPLKPVNYEDYKSYVRGLLGTQQEAPDAFVEYVYERSPKRALLVFHLATPPPRDKDILLTVQIVSNSLWLKKNGFDDRFQQSLPHAVAELAKLAKHEQWWARLYAAEIMRRHRDLRQPELWQQLSMDGNKLVSKAAKAVRD
jgi:hypothetical protein